MFNLKDLKSAVEVLAGSRRLPKDVLQEVIEAGFSAAYKKEYGKPDQIVRASFNSETGDINFFQAKIVLSKEDILPEDEIRKDEEDTRVKFNPEKHIMIEDAVLVQNNVQVGEKILFPLESKTEFGRIATQSAKQSIGQKLYEIERNIVVQEFENMEGELVLGQVQRMERGNIYVNLGKTLAVLPFTETLPKDRFKQGDKIRALISKVDINKKNDSFIRLSRTSSDFILQLFKNESPELAEGKISVHKIIRDPGIRTKIAVKSVDEETDPIGSLVGARGIRVFTVKNEINGEQIDIVEYSTNEEDFVEESLSPAEVLSVSIEDNIAKVIVSEEQIPVSIGKYGQNLKLASQLVGKNIEIIDQKKTVIAVGRTEGSVEILSKKEYPEQKKEEHTEKNEEVSKQSKVEKTDDETLEKQDPEVQENKN